jgi:uroporphyrinogen-III synthase
VTIPRALVVRSGSDPFAAAANSGRLEIVERVSHAIEPVEVAEREIPARADLVVFSSRIAVDQALDVPGSPLFRCILDAGRVLAVGHATEAALRARGVVRTVAGGGSAGALLAALPERLDGQTVLFPCGADALPELSEGLRARGARVIPLIVYRKTPNPADPALEREILERPFAAFCATAPSAARWLFDGVGPAGQERLRRTPAVVLGGATLRWLAARGVERIEVAPEARFPAAARLLEALAIGQPEK